MNLQTAINVSTIVQSNAGYCEPSLVDEFGYTVPLGIKVTDNGIVFCNALAHSGGVKIMSELSYMITFLKSVECIYGNLKVTFLKEDGEETKIGFVSDGNNLKFVGGK